MAEAIKKISVARGYDVTHYALNCFGGAGGQHACESPTRSAIKTVLIHPLSSLLSAYGMGLADIRARVQGVEEPWSPWRWKSCVRSRTASKAKRSARWQGRASRERRSRPSAARIFATPARGRPSKCP